MPNRKKSQYDRNQLVKAIFAAAEGMGIVDRKLLEGLISQVIHRLEGTQPLPGMEELVPPPPPPPSSQLQAIVKEVLEKAQPTAIPLTPNALKVLEKRYLKRDAEGKVVETPEQMFRRVAENIASAEKLFDPLFNIDKVKFWEEEFYRVMTSLEFLPNSPTLMNAGRELQQLSACFVLPIEDSMESIFDAVKYTALIHKSGGGTGFSFSRLRPENDKVGSTGGVASGPVSFMRAFDTATEVIKQGGMRRGANMGILIYNHPDIMKFVTAKEDPTQLTNFNLSVAITEEFMEKVIKGEDIELINPRTKQVVRKLNAKELFDKIVEMAWKTGDPGLVFIDRINRDNPTPHLGEIESTNPCGEQPLLPYESCNLGSINLAKMITYRNGKPEIDYGKLERTVKIAVRFLDNVIEVNKFPIPEIEEKTKATRKIGLGVMGFADMLIQLRIPYDSEEAVKVAEEVMGFINKKATEASQELAEERGVFPAFRGSIYDRPGMPRVRNATRTTIAPTGTISIIAGCSSGIEPLFALCYVRQVLEGERLIEINPYFEEVAKKEGFYSPKLIDDLASGKKLRELEGIPEWVKRVFVTAHDIAPEWHVKIQAAFQRHTDNAVSKTVNLPHYATKEDVAKVFFLAYKENLKGITVYRDRSRETQVLSIPKAEGKEVAHLPRPRPKVTTGFTEKVTTGCGNLYITVNRDEKGICEVFSSLGKAGGCASAQLEATSRLISLALRSGIDIASIIKQLKGIRCPSIAWEEGYAVLSCADAISRVLEKHLGGETPPPSATASGGQCPECGDLLIYQEGCFYCRNCGYTKCS